MSPSEEFPTLHLTAFHNDIFQDQLDDETLFPSKIGVPFPPNFQVRHKDIFIGPRYTFGSIYGSMGLFVLIKTVALLQTIAKTILKRLFRVYAHIYHQHFKVPTKNIEKHKNL